MACDGLSSTVTLPVTSRRRHSFVPFMTASVHSVWLFWRKEKDRKNKISSQDTGRVGSRSDNKMHKESSDKFVGGQFSVIQEPKYRCTVYFWISWMMIRRKKAWRQKRMGPERRVELPHPFTGKIITQCSRGRLGKGLFWPKTKRRWKYFVLVVLNSNWLSLLVAENKKKSTNCVQWAQQCPTTCTFAMSMTFRLSMLNPTALWMVHPELSFVPAVMKWVKSVSRNWRGQRGNFGRKEDPPKGNKNSQEEQMIADIAVKVHPLYNRRQEFSPVVHFFTSLTLRAATLAAHSTNSNLSILLQRFSAERLRPRQESACVIHVMFFHLKLPITSVCSLGALVSPDSSTVPISHRCTCVEHTLFMCCSTCIVRCYYLITIWQFIFLQFFITFIRRNNGSHNDGVPSDFSHRNFLWSFAKWMVPHFPSEYCCCYLFLKGSPHNDTTVSHQLLCQVAISSNLLLEIGLPPQYRCCWAKNCVSEQSRIRKFRVEAGRMLLRTFSYRSRQPISHFRSVLNISFFSCKTSTKNTALGRSKDQFCFKKIRAKELSELCFSHQMGARDKLSRRKQ